MVCVLCNTECVFDWDSFFAGGSLWTSRYVCPNGHIVTVRLGLKSMLDAAQPQPESHQAEPKRRKTRRGKK